MGMFYSTDLWVLGKEHSQIGMTQIHKNQERYKSHAFISGKARIFSSSEPVRASALPFLLLCFVLTNNLNNVNVIEVLQV